MVSWPIEGALPKLITIRIGELGNLVNNVQSKHVALL